MLELLEKIRTRRQATEEQRTRSYVELVRAAGDGEDVNEAEADAVLDRSDKSFDQFAADVALYRKRKLWRKQLDAREQGEQRLAEIEEQIAAERRKLEEAQKQFNVFLKPLRDERERLRAESVAAVSAQQQLCDTVIDPSYKQRSEDLAANRRDVAQRRQPLIDHATRLDQRIGRIGRRLDEIEEHRRRNGGLTQQRQEEKYSLEEDRGYVQSERDQLQQRIDAANAEHAELEREGDELRELAFMP